MESNARFWRLHMLDAHSSRTIKMVQPRLRPADQLIKIRDPNNRIKIKTVTKFSDPTGRKRWLQLDTNSLILQKATTKQEYYQLNKKMSLIRLTTQKIEQYKWLQWKIRRRKITYMPSFPPKRKWNGPSG